MVDFDKVQTLLAAASPKDIEEITPEKHLVSDLELDSFGLLDLIISFEDEFHIEIPDRDIRNLDTVNDVILYLDEKTQGQSHAAPAY